MLRELRISFALTCLFSPLLAQEMHEHSAPEKLGTVSFPISCAPAIQEPFNRAVALLHSFAYAAARQAFQQVASQDPHCAIAHWGVAMTYFHQLWDPPLSTSANPIADHELDLADRIGAGSEREGWFIHGLEHIYRDSDPYPVRALRYEHAMGDLYAAYPKDVEVQVFYALALLASASPSDKTHAKQKKATGLLEPLFQAYPQHPGVAHYLIHACDNAELAERGLPAARSYAQIAPSAPHALHMPSHIFTRLGLWDDSIASNLAARKAAHQQGDTGEELHAMDYLVYAYLQSGRDQEAGAIVEQLKAMQQLNPADFKIAYAMTAMPVRYAVERGQWRDAETISPPPGAPPHVVAIAVWARGIGLARSGHPREAHAEADRLRELAQQLRQFGSDYWAAQVHIEELQVKAWCAQAEHNPRLARDLMRASADSEDSIEKLPVTPGPIVPAREQLGYLLLQQHEPAQAAREFQSALATYPGRRGLLWGVSVSTGRDPSH